MRSNSVVLPAPFGPMRPRISPSRTRERHVVTARMPPKRIGDARAPRAPAFPRPPSRDGSARRRRRRRRPRVAAPRSRRRRRRAPSRNTDAQDVGPVEQVGGRAVEADLALLHEDAARPAVRATFTDCSTRTTVVPWRGWRATIPSSCSTTIGRQAERQLVDHQQLGLAMNACPSVSICCSPPDRLPACSSSARAGPGSSSSTSLGRRRARTSGRPGTASRRARRFSATVRVGNTPLPPGTCTMPRPTSRRAACG